MIQAQKSSEHGQSSKCDGDCCSTHTRCLTRCEQLSRVHIAGSPSTRFPYNRPRAHTIEDGRGCTECKMRSDKTVAQPSTIFHARGLKFYTVPLVRVGFSFCTGPETPKSKNVMHTPTVNAPSPIPSYKATHKINSVCVGTAKSVDGANTTTNNKLKLMETHTHTHRQ